MSISCPKCRAKLSIPDEKLSAGAKFRCPKCSAVLAYRGAPNANRQTAPPARSTAQTETRTSPHPENVETGSPGRASVEQLPKAPPPPAMPAPQRSRPLPERDVSGPSPEDIAKAKEMAERHGYPKKETIEQKSFFEHLPETFSFPLRRGGLMMLVVGSVFFTVLLFFAKYAFIVGGLGFTIVGGYIASFMMKVVTHSADGEPEIPDWPDFADFWDDILCPSGQLTVTSLVSFSPLIVYLAFAFGTGMQVSIPIVFIFVLLGAFYYPIALLSMSLFHGIGALNPVVLVPAIFKVFSDYLVAAGLFLVIVLLKWSFTFFLKEIPFIGAFLDNFLMLYFLTLEMRILGLIYFSNKEKLAWF